MEIPRPPVYYSPKHSVVSCYEGRVARVNRTAGRRSPVLALAAPRFYTSGSHACSGTREEENPKANQQQPAATSKSDGIPGERSGAELKDLARAALG
ncbi:hypothetical protein NDU88_005972 [Pleurodeles waltl]|uniref:Uncharacterized protein n=1 Tax=Pleurodeles waltl TaxID=8319 RepID=A0AAV7NQL7_PLEWA|nr:hypothetical protein NDU88_005972 [Pleurodeles waltl]